MRGMGDKQFSRQNSSTANTAEKKFVQGKPHENKNRASAFYYPRNEKILAQAIAHQKIHAQPKGERKKKIHAPEN